VRNKGWVILGGVARAAVAIATAVVIAVVFMPDMPGLVVVESFAIGLLGGIWASHYMLSRLE
jgi:hypothetical protein